MTLKPYDPSDDLKREDKQYDMVDAVWHLPFLKDDYTRMCVKSMLSLFCLEYIRHFNSNKAYKAANFPHEGYAESTIKGRALDILRIDGVKDRINQLATERAKAVEVDASLVISRLLENANIARELDDVNGERQALVALGKHLKLFTDVQEQRMVFTKMNDIVITDEAGQERALEFNVGEAPDNAIDAEYVELDNE